MTPHRKNQRGAALLLVLLLTVLMSGIILAVMDDLRFAIRRTVNVRAQDQAIWYALGAEDLARQVIWRSWKTQPDRSLLTDPWAVEDVTFATGEGAITGSVRDGGNCFNLNAIDYRPDEDQPQDGRPLGTVQFINLAVALGLNQDAAENIAAALGDWIDADTNPRPRGAEDSNYMRLTPPYRTAGTMLVDPSELRAIRGVTAEIYSVLRPYICTPQSSEPNRINVNTLSLEQAPLIVMLIGEDVSLASAQRVIERRPRSGYRSLDEFWGREELARFNVSEAVRMQTGLVTRDFIMTSRVTHLDTSFSTIALLQMDESGHISVRGRRFGGIE